MGTENTILDWDLPAGVLPITKTQPQIAQLELLFKGPLVKDSVVETLDDLPKIKSKYNYQHKRVWVKEHNCEYFLENGDGTDILNWKRSIGRMVVNKWKNTEVYLAGDVVSIGGKLFYATKNVPININPVSNEKYWQVVTGEIETYRYLFYNTSSLIIYTEIRNPFFQVVLGDPVIDEDGAPVLDEETGLIQMHNKEIIDACIVQREDMQNKPGDLLPNNEGGIPYEISFFEDEIPKVMKSGCVNVK